MKKVLIVTNHLQYGDGVCRTLISFANALSELDEYDVTISFMLRFDKSLLPSFSDKVKIRRAFKIPCFKGLDRLMSYLPGKYLYKRASKKEKFDIEIGYCWKNPTIAISNSTNKEATRIIYTHGYNPESAYLVKNDAAIAISSENLERFKKETNGEVPIYRFSNIFDEQLILEYADKAPLFSKEEGKFLFMASGRLSSEKGYLRLVEVVNKLINEDKYDFNLWIAGDGPLRGELESLVSKYHLEDHVKLLGNQSNPYNLVKQADCFICSSFNEGYSTTCVEACILEVPVLTTKVSGANDIIGDAKAGMVVDNSENGLYQGMKFMLDNPKEVQKYKAQLGKSKKVFYKESRKKMLDELLKEITNLKK